MVCSGNTLVFTVLWGVLGASVRKATGAMAITVQVIQCVT